MSGTLPEAARTELVATMRSFDGCVKYEMGSEVLVAVETRNSLGRIRGRWLPSTGNVSNALILKLFHLIFECASVSFGHAAVEEPISC